MIIDYFKNIDTGITYKVIKMYDSKIDSSNTVILNGFVEPIRIVSDDTFKWCYVCEDFFSEVDSFEKKYYSATVVSGVVEVSKNNDYVILD